MVGVIVGGLALVVIILVGIDCHRKRTRKRKLNALLGKRYGSTSHFFQNIVKNGEIIFQKTAFLFNCPWFTWTFTRYINRFNSCD